MREAAIGVCPVLRHSRENASCAGIVIQTARLMLRAPRRRDARQLYAYASDEAVSRYVLWETHQSLSDSRAALSGLLSGNRREGLCALAVIRKLDGRMVGTIGLVWRDPVNQSAEVGFSLARDCWGQGLMTEALTAYLRHAFTRLGVNRMEAQHDRRNPASGRVMEKAGMKSEGLLRGRMYYKGAYADLALYAALREEWLDAHPENGTSRLDETGIAKEARR